MQGGARERSFLSVLQKKTAAEKLRFFYLDAP